MENIVIFENAQQAVEKIAQDFVAYSQIGQPIHISLSGGSTPKLLFKTLASSPFKESIQWQNLHFWWGDERLVPAESEESNYGEVKRSLFDHIQIPAKNIHFIDGNLAPQTALAKFEQDIESTIPHHIFDWIILGMGDDGHTASLFPQQTNFADNGLATLAQHPQTGQLRVSKTAKLIEQAKRITFLVTGSKKAAILQEIQVTDPQRLAYPAAKIKSANGKTEWYLDKDAAIKLQETL